jgi:hypothetical protein
MLNIGKYTSHAHSLKREREVEKISTPPDLQESFSRPEGSIPEQITALLGHPIQETDHLFSLPLFTEDLGRLPVYDPFDYEPTFQPNEFEPDPLYNVDSALGEPSTCLWLWVCTDLAFRLDFLPATGQTPRR